MGTFSDITKNVFEVRADSTDYMLNKYKPLGFSYEQIIVMAMAKERSKENKAFEKYEHSFAKKEYETASMLAIFDIIEMGYNPDEYVFTEMTPKEIQEVKDLLIERNKEGIRNRIEKMREGSQTNIYSNDINYKER